MPDPTILLAIPVHNEERYVSRVISETLRYIDRVLVVDDGSTDRTPSLLAEHPVEVVRHGVNRGYGRAMQDMFRWAACDGYDWLITMDCDEQHEPASIPTFIEAIRRDDADVISGTRYLLPTPASDAPPADRRSINATITAELNRRLGLRITDAFCGFKAYRTEEVRRLTLDVDGYDFPMQFWVQAVAARLRITELPVRMIYNDPSRSFGDSLDDPTHRLHHYRTTLQREIVRCETRLPRSAQIGAAGSLAHRGADEGSECLGCGAG